MMLQAGQKIGRFSVIGQLGKGGMSSVYLARDPDNDRDVVLKFPFEEMLGDVTWHERFRREVKIGELLKHAHIQALYELADANSVEFMVLEYVPGKPLRDVLAERNGHKRADSDIEQAIDLATQIGSALAYAHSHSVAHRDLKPENIIITPDNQAKVMDFGIALLKGARRVTWGPLSNQVGTPDYMSPEQIQGSRGDARTDVYALGMILYEFLTGKLPYHGDNPLAIMNQHVNAKAPPLSKYRRDIPEALDEVIMKAIRRRPDDRWQNMQAFMEALHNWQTLDTTTLKAEREAEPDAARIAKNASLLGIPASRMSVIVALVIVAMVALALLAGHFAGHSHPH